MRVQVAHPAEHAAIASLPFREALETWQSPNVHDVLGLHRHVVKLVEVGGSSYVVKELPDHLALREYRCCARSTSSACRPSRSSRS
jgi:hypothetical protein